MKINPYKVLSELAFERLAGSDNERKAAEIITSHIESLGLKVVTDKFEIHCFDTGTGSLTVDGKDYEVVPFGLSNEVEIEAEMIFLENPDILLHNKKMYKGKIVLSYGYSRKIQESIQNQELAAFIAIGSPARKAPSWSHRQKSYVDGTFVGATVSYDDATKISKFDGKVVKLSIKQSASKREAANLIVDIAGSKPDGNLTYLVAHYDSVARTEGASDNLGGTVSLIKIAEHFAAKRPKRDLRIIFFSGEEMGLLGSQHYVKSNEEEVKTRGSLVMNIDVTGDPIGQNRVIVTGTPELLGYTDGITKEKGHCLHHSLDIYSSDQMPFTKFELPGLSIARFGGKGSFYIHTPDDNRKNVSPAGLKQPIEAATLILDRILNADIYPVKREIDNSLREKIEKYFWNLNFEEPKLEWTPKYKL